MSRAVSTRAPVLCQATAYMALDSVARIRAAQAAFLAVLAKEAGANDLWAHIPLGRIGKADALTSNADRHLAQCKAAMDQMLDEALDQALLARAGELI
ncbi:MAG TPA: hypothetical protein PKY87_14635 [Terricaulis sp.]|nr:hypothetical protein [Terricaulis sp.]